MSDIEVSKKYCGATSGRQNLLHLATTTTKHTIGMDG
jgi:hypothetical protein